MNGVSFLIAGMLNLGKWNELKVQERMDNGFLLDGGTAGPVRLPDACVTEPMAVGQSVRVFVYNDSEERLVGTTKRPFVEVGEIAYLEVIGINERIGFFLDWGLDKDLLLPYREQDDDPLEVGDGIVVAVYVDEYTNRIVASTRLHRHFTEQRPAYEPNDAVHILIYGDSPLGYKAIVDKCYRGLLYHSETADQLETGDQFTGYVRTVRADGKIDLRRDPAGYGRVESIREVILNKLEAADGKLPFNDKSDSEAIRKSFKTSKKAFKQALGALYKERLIRFTETGIERVDGE